MKHDVTERPILFNGEMVRAILEGRKTQTRRVIKPQPRVHNVKDDCHRGLQRCHECDDFGCCDNMAIWQYECPYGTVGDRLWVQEDFADWEQATCYKATMTWGNRKSQTSDDCGACDDVTRLNVWRPAKEMELIDSRILLEITGLRVQMVQDISEEDALAEGAYKPPCTMDWDIAQEIAQQDFRPLWNSIYEKEGFGWDKNPWVWVIEFKRVH